MLFKKSTTTISAIMISLSGVIFSDDVASAFVIPTAATTTTTTTNESQVNKRIQHTSQEEESFLEIGTTTRTMGNIGIRKGKLSSSSTSSSSSSTTKRTLFGPNKKVEITKLNSAEDYMDFLLEDDRLCMVKFYAPNCKSCQQMGMHYKRIGKEIGDLVSTSSSSGADKNNDDELEESEEVVVREGEIRLAEIDYGSNKELCQRLGVIKLPTIHIYSEGGTKVDGFPCGPKKLPILLRKLSEYRSMSSIDLKFEAEMNQGMELGETVLEALNCEVAAAAAAANTDAAGAFC